MLLNRRHKNRNQNKKTPLSSISKQEPKTETKKRTGRKKKTEVKGE